MSSPPQHPLLDVDHQLVVQIASIYGQKRIRLWMLGVCEISREILRGEEGVGGFFGRLMRAVWRSCLWGPRQRDEHMAAFTSLPLWRR